VAAADLGGFETGQQIGWPSADVCGAADERMVDAACSLSKWERVRVRVETSARMSS
jgi:hypothetical protein